MKYYIDGKVTVSFSAPIVAEDEDEARKKVIEEIDIDLPSFLNDVAQRGDGWEFDGVEITNIQQAEPAEVEKD
jgi:hypothetical protein